MLFGMVLMSETNYSLSTKDNFSRGQLYLLGAGAKEGLAVGLFIIIF